MFDWLGDIFSGIGNAIGDTIEYLGTQIANTIFDAILQWFYEIIYGAVADFFTMMGNMGAEIFDLSWVQSTIRLFTLFGWSLFVAGTVVAIFDVAIEYQNGRANIKTTSINILKGFFACSLIGVVPVELYKFCISLQNTFAHDLTSIVAGGQNLDLAGQSTSVLEGSFAVSTQVTFGLLNLLCLIAFAYCVIKIFFQNIKRGGILLVQMAVGSLYICSKRKVKESWTCTNDACGCRVRISDTDLLMKVTLLMNRVIENADLMVPKPRKRVKDSPAVQRLQNEIDIELSADQPSEKFIASRICEIASQLYKETNAKEQIAARIAQKRVMLMNPQTEFNSVYFTDLVENVILKAPARVSLLTKTDVQISEGVPDHGSQENTEKNGDAD